MLLWQAQGRLCTHIWLVLHWSGASGILDFCGAVAQLGECLNGIEEVEGSSPSSSTKLDEIKNFHAKVQVGAVGQVRGPRQPVISKTAAPRKRWHFAPEHAPPERSRSRMRKTSSWLLSRLPTNLSEDSFGRLQTSLPRDPESNSRSLIWHRLPSKLSLTG